MAATLPAIHQAQRVQSGGGQPFPVLSGPQKNMASPKIILASGRMKHYQGKKERESDLKKAALRSQQPRLQNMETSK